MCFPCLAFFFFLPESELKTWNQCRPRGPATSSGPVPERRACGRLSRLRGCGGAMAVPLAMTVAPRLPCHCPDQELDGNPEQQQSPRMRLTRFCAAVRRALCSEPHAVDKHAAWCSGKGWERPGGRGVSPYPLSLSPYILFGQRRIFLRSGIIAHSELEHVLQEHQPLAGACPPPQGPVSFPSVQWGDRDPSLAGLLGGTRGRGSQRGPGLPVAVHRWCSFLTMKWLIKNEGRWAFP